MPNKANTAEDAKEALRVETRTPPATEISGTEIYSLCIGEAGGICQARAFEGRREYMRIPARRAQQEPLQKHEGASAQPSGEAPRSLFTPA